MEIFTETYTYCNHHDNYSFVAELSLFNLRYLIFIVGNHTSCCIENIFIQTTTINYRVDINLFIIIIATSTNLAYSAAAYELCSLFERKNLSRKYSLSGFCIE